MTCALCNLPICDHRDDQWAGNVASIIRSPAVLTPAAGNRGLASETILHDTSPLGEGGK